MTTDEDAHQRIRKLLMPPFHGAALQSYRHMIRELAAEEVNRWPVDTPFSAQPRMKALTLEIILRVVLGATEGPQLEELRGALSRLLSSFSRRSRPALRHKRSRTFWNPPRFAGTRRRNLSG